MSGCANKFVLPFAVLVYPKVGMVSDDELPICKLVVRPSRVNFRLILQ